MSETFVARLVFLRVYSSSKRKSAPESSVLIFSTLSSLDRDFTIERSWIYASRTSLFHAAYLLKFLDKNENICFKHKNPSMSRYFDTKDRLKSELDACKIKNNTRIFDGKVHLKSELCMSERTFALQHGMLGIVSTAHIIT